MGKETIEKNLKKTLLGAKRMSWDLFEYELEEHIEEYKQSKRADGDKFFFVVTENSNDVAMLLIDEEDRLYINERARLKLMLLWDKAYRHNIRTLLPKMVSVLDAGVVFSAGVKTALISFATR